MVTQSRTHTQAYETTRTLCEKPTLDLVQLRILEKAYEQKCDEFRNSNKHVFDVPRANYVDSLQAVRDVINARTLEQQAQQLTLSPQSNPSKVYSFADYAKQITQKAVAAVLVGAVSLSTLLYTSSARADDDDHRARWRQQYDNKQTKKDSTDTKTGSHSLEASSTDMPQERTSYDASERDSRRNRDTSQKSKNNNLKSSAVDCEVQPQKINDDSRDDPNRPLEYEIDPSQPPIEVSPETKIRGELLNYEFPTNNSSARTSIGGCINPEELEASAQLNTRRNTPTYSPRRFYLTPASSNNRIEYCIGPTDAQILNTIFLKPTTALPTSPVKEFTRNRGGDEQKREYTEKNPLKSEPMAPLLPKLGITRTPFIRDVAGNDIDWNTGWTTNYVEGKHHPRYEAREVRRNAHPEKFSSKPMKPLFGDRRTSQEWFDEQRNYVAPPNSREERRAKTQARWTERKEIPSLAELFYAPRRELKAGELLYLLRDQDFNLIQSGSFSTFVWDSSIDQFLADDTNTNYFMRYALALDGGKLKDAQQEIENIYKLNGVVTEQAGKEVFENNPNLDSLLNKLVKKANADARWNEYDLTDRVLRFHREKILTEIVKKTDLTSEQRVNAVLYATSALAKAASTKKREFFGLRVLNDIIQAPSNLVVRDVSHLAHKNRPGIDTSHFDSSFNAYLVNLVLGYEGPRNDYTRTGENLLHTGLDALTIVGLVSGVWAGASAISGGSIKGPSALIGGNGHGGIFGGEIQHGGIGGHRSRNVRFNPVGEGKPLIKRNNGYHGFKKSGALNSQRRSR